MSDLDFLIPENIPLWELTIIAVAAVAVLLVFIVWYFLGYNLVVVPNEPAVMNKLSSSFIGLML
ncbi:MAG: hypothetical protein ABIH11_07145 [Candidatus Altiarchaeota archaeon]